MPTPLFGPTNGRRTDDEQTKGKGHTTRNDGGHSTKKLERRKAKGQKLQGGRQGTLQPAVSAADEQKKKH